jgi:hypothetical protein
LQIGKRYLNAQFRAVKHVAPSNAAIICSSCVYQHLVRSSSLPKMPFQCLISLSPKSSASQSSQSSSSSSSCLPALLFCSLRFSSSSVTLFLTKTSARISLASRSRVAKLSGDLPSPSKPTMRSTPTPSMKARTHGRTWIPSLVTRNGQLSTLIFSMRAS